jgi:hypothetical protein
LQRRFTPERTLVSAARLVPAKDLLQTALWIFAFAGNNVEWRGRKMKLRRDGTLVRVSRPLPLPPVQPQVKNLPPPVEDILA